MQTSDSSDERLLDDKNGLIMGGDISAGKEEFIRVDKREKLA